MNGRTRRSSSIVVEHIARHVCNNISDVVAKTTTTTTITYGTHSGAAAAAAAAASNMLLLSFIRAHGICAVEWP